jgi:hypothetical protein
MVILEGNNKPQIQAITDAIEVKLENLLCSKITYVIIKYIGSIKREIF